MKRTTLTLQDDLVTKLEYEARRRRTSVSDVARQALREHFRLDDPTPREIPFAALGASGYTDTGARFEEILSEEWDRDFEEMMGRARDR